MISQFRIKSLTAAVLAGLVLVLAACSGSAATPAAQQNLGFGAASETGGKDLSGVAGPTGAPAPAQSVVPGDTTLIVRTGTMSLVVKDVPAAVTAARNAIVALGGYVSGDSAQGGDDPSAEVAYRVPVARFDDAQAAMRTLAVRVVNEHSDSSDVTGQVIDLAARLDNLRVTEKALQAIMNQAVKIQDVLDVQTQLTDVRGQIEELTAQETHLENQAAMSTLTVDFGVEVPVTTATSRNWDPGQVVDQATATLLSLGQGLASLGIVFVIVGLPVLLGLAVLAALISGLWRLTRRLRRRPAA